MAKITKQSEEDKDWMEIANFMSKVESGEITITKSMFLEKLREMIDKIKEKHGTISDEEHCEMAMKYARSEIDSIEKEIKRIKENR